MVFYTPFPTFFSFLLPVFCLFCYFVVSVIFID